MDNLTFKDIGKYPIIGTLQIPNTDLSVEFRSIKCIVSNWLILVLPSPIRHANGIVEVYGVVELHQGKIREIVGTDQAIIDVLTPHMLTYLKQQNPNMDVPVYPDPYLIQTNFQRAMCCGIYEMDPVEVRSLLMHTREMLEDVKRLVKVTDLAQVIPQLQSLHREIG